jgi:hypothetical protein
LSADPAPVKGARRLRQHAAGPPPATPKDGPLQAANVTIAFRKININTIALFFSAASKKAQYYCINFVRQYAGDKSHAGVSAAAKTGIRDETRSPTMIERLTTRQICSQSKFDRTGLNG